MRFVLTLLLCLAAPAAAFAYDGTPAEQDACTSDVFSLCSAFIPDEAPILSCLKSKHAQLSTGCAQVLFPPTASTRHRRRANG